MPDFMVLILESEASGAALAPLATRALLEGQAAYAQKLRAAAVYRDGERLRPSAEGRRVSLRAGEPRVEGPTLVTSLLNENLLDELKLIVHPLLLGGGKSLFTGVSQRRSLQFVQAEPTKSGKVILTYRT